jgi:hypothetical protein
VAHGAVGMAATVRPIRGIGRARCRITTDRDMVATGATGHRTTGRPRLFVIRLITAQEPGLAISRVTVLLPTGVSRRFSRSRIGRHRIGLRKTDRRLTGAGRRSNRSRISRHKTGRHRTGHHRTGRRRIGRHRISRHRIGRRRIGRRRTDRRLIRIGHRTSRNHRSRAGTANGIPASHEFSIVLAQLRSGGAHSRSLGYARDDKGWVGASRGIWLMDERVRGREQWYPTQAKTGLEWGTQPSLTVRQSKNVTAFRDDKVEGGVYLCIGYEGWVALGDLVRAIAAMALTRGARCRSCGRRQPIAPCARWRER